MSILKKEYCIIFLSSLALFFTCAAGLVDTVDAVPSIETAKSILTKGSPGLTTLQKRDTMLYSHGRDGAWYSKMGLAMPVLYLVPVGLGVFQSQWIADEKTVTDFLVSFVNPFLTAILSLILFHFFRQRSSLNNAILMTTAACLATLILPYSKGCHREILQALCITAAFVFLSPANDKPARHNFLISGSFLALGILTKQAFLVVALPAMMLAFIRIRHSDKHNILFFSLPIIISLFIWSVFSWQAWGNPSATGYGNQVTSLNKAVWSHPFWSGIFLQWLSISKGLFTYNPILLLLPVVVWQKARRLELSALDFLVLAAALFQTALYASWFSPVGHEALGPRYLMVILPLLFLLFPLPHLRLRNRSGRSIALALFIFSVFFQIIHTSVKTQQYYTLQQRAKTHLRSPHWLANTKMFMHKLTQQDERYPLSFFGIDSTDTVDMNDLRSMIGFNYWWLHLRRFQKSESVRSKPQTTQRCQPQSNQFTQQLSESNALSELPS